MNIPFIRLALIVGIAVAPSLPSMAWAQDRIPDATRTATPDEPAEPPLVAGERFDLAAMALDTTDIPPEFQLVFETYYDPQQVIQQLVGDQVSPQDLEAMGLLWYYQSSYSTPTGSSQLRSYLEEYTDDAGAIRGFEILEDEKRFVPEADLADEPGPGIGEEPSEITIGTFAEAVPATGPTTIDITFRVGRIIAGVTMDAGEGLTVDRELMLDLAARLEARITAVLTGEPLPLIDTSLPERYVGLGEGWGVTNEGYWSIPELYGPDASPAIVGSFESGYFRADAYDPGNTGGFPIPRAAIEVAEFVDEQSALVLLSDLDTLRPAVATLEPVAIDPVPGSSVTLGYQFANTFFGETTIDSFRVIMLVDSFVVTVDVQGNGSAEEARVAAVAIATAQAACLQATEPCQVESFPSDLFVVPATPESGDPVG